MFGRPSVVPTHVAPTAGPGHVGPSRPENHGSATGGASAASVYPKRAARTSRVLGILSTIQTIADLHPRRQQHRQHTTAEAEARGVSGAFSVTTDPSFCRARAAGARETRWTSV